MDQVYTPKGSSSIHRKLAQVGWLLMAEIRRSPVEVGSFSHYLQGLEYIPGGWLGFQPSTVGLKFSGLHSMIRNRQINLGELHPAGCFPENSGRFKKNPSYYSLTFFFGGVGDSTQRNG